MSTSRQYWLNTSSLSLVAQVQPSGKATRESMHRWMKVVPKIQRLKDQGWDARSFDRLLKSPDPVQRELGETERNLFRAGPTRITADYQDGRVTLDNGNHRVLAAREVGTLELPVHVRAKDEQQHLEMKRKFNAREISDDRILERTDRDRDSR